MSPTLYSFSGLPGVGKSTLAQALAREVGATYLRIDSVEQALRGSVGALHGPEGYAVAYAVAADNLRLGRAVVADCVNPLALTRAAWRQVAEQAGARCVELEVVCSDVAEHRRRVEGRAVEVPGLKRPSWAEVTAREYAPWEGPRLVVDTAGRRPEACLQQIKAALKL